jgi:hypothetical protein
VISFLKTHISKGKILAVLEQRPCESQKKGGKVWSLARALFASFLEGREQQVKAENGM